MLAATFDLNGVAVAQEQFGEKITRAFCIDAYFELKLTLLIHDLALCAPIPDARILKGVRQG